MTGFDINKWLEFLLIKRSSGCYGDTIYTLLDAFLTLMIKKHPFEPEDMEMKIFESTIGAYFITYGEIVTEEEIEDMSTPDARKMDLLFRGTKRMILDELITDSELKGLFGNGGKKKKSN